MKVMENKIKIRARPGIGDEWGWGHHAALKANINPHHLWSTHLSLGFPTAKEERKYS